MPDAGIYTVAWICAIHPEYIAAEVFLDEKHGLPNLAASDENTYTVGKLAGHNVVISVLPDAQYGISAATSLVRDMLSSFPNVRTGLLVGIAGGVPSAGNDIRLGDVVVSVPGKKHGGVLQYDFGKAIQDKKFQITGFLNKPPKLLRTAVANTKVEYEMKGHLLQQAINVALDQNPRLRCKYQRPSNNSDILFHSHVVHKDVVGASCAIDCYDGPASLIERRQRTSEEDDPAIHYGTIASANQLMKDGTVRDALAAEEEVLCFEMEAAGLMDELPCIVIRGICDYADSHKNKQWQGYAAMAAAAYAKDLLRRVSPKRVEAERPIFAIIESVGLEVRNGMSTTEKIKEDVHRIDEAVLKSQQRIILGQLPTAKGASFDSSSEEHNPRCLLSTRVDLLNEIETWASDSNASAIFWLNGMAGTGKSTIARTVAHSSTARGRLGASFFFKRGEADRGNISKFFPTIAADLLHRIPDTAAHIRDALEADASLSDRNTQQQFQQLFLQPLSKISNHTRDAPIIFVVDALDECEEDNDIKLLIRLFFRAKKELQNQIKVFLTSRPELPLRLEFMLQGTHQNVILHEISQSLVEHDMFCFFQHGLDEIRVSFNASVDYSRRLSPGWPGPSAARSLAAMSVPLFIFAATLCRFIGDRKRGNPEKQLASVLNHQANSRYTALGDMYLLVLNQQIAGFEQEEADAIVQEFRDIIGPIILLGSPLSPAALSQLLEISQTTIVDRLDMLHSVLSVPESKISPVKLLHLSFRDFLLKEKTRFWINENKTHRTLATRCLQILSRLEKNICRVRSPGMTCSDIGTETINSCLPAELQYACIFWIHHLKETDISIFDDADVHMFLTRHFLHWMEALSLMGRASEGLNLLRILEIRVKECYAPETSAFLEDATRFLQMHLATIILTPLQLYCSLLIFTPKQSKVRITFENSEDADKWIHLKPHMRDFWSSCRQTLEGHTELIGSVSFSHDSKLLASGSYDNTVRIWRTETGECVQTLTGHGSFVRSVAFSHDSMLLLSGSDDRIVGIWNTNTGECLEAFRGHTGGVSSVSFSFNSTLVVSGSEDMTIRIWRAGTGECLSCLKGHTGSVSSVVFSHDSTLVLSGSMDHTVRLWRAETGECLRILAGHGDQVESAAFSRDSNLIISASINGTLRVWSTNTGHCVQTLAVDKGVSSAVFSHDSELIAFNPGYDLKLWRVNTDECIQVSAEGPFWPLAFSHDSTMIASGGGEIRIWQTGDVGRGIQKQNLHEATVHSVVLSHDATLVASSSIESTTRIWDTETGDCIQTFLHVDGQRVKSARFSYDSTLIALAFSKKTMQIWHIRTGERIRELEGHIDDPFAVALAPSLLFAASTGGDKTVQVWNVQTGKCVQTLDGHSTSVSCVEFSHDSTLVASGSLDGMIRIWRLGTDECVQIVNSGKGDAHFESLVLSHDLALMAIATDQTLRVWCLATNKCVQTENIQHEGTLRFNQDDSRLESSAGAVLIRDSGSRVTNTSVKISGIGCSDPWITCNGENLLRLPVGFQRSCLTVSGSVVAIGAWGGSLLILRISLDSLTY